MLKSVGRFLVVLFIAALLGTSLYLAMHYVIQPIFTRTDSEPVAENSGRTAPRPIQLPSMEEFVRGSFSVVKNVLVFVVVTVLVLTVQKLNPKRRQKVEQEE